MPSSRSSVAYTVRRHKRAKRLRISVYHDTKVVVTAPRWVTHRSIEKFVLSKKDWIKEQRAYFRKKIPLDKKSGIAQPSYAACKARATKFITRRVEWWAEQHGFRYNRISVKHTTSQWGSCSSDKNLSFTYKLLFLPRPIADYVIVHELCHLRHMDHSPAYWKQVERIMPDYKKRREALKQYLLK